MHLLDQSIDLLMTSVDDSVAMFTYALLQAGSVCKRNIIHTKVCSWFVQQCRIAKCRENALLNKLRRSRCNFYLQQFLNAKKFYNNLCDTKRKEYNQQIVDEVEKVAD